MDEILKSNGFTLIRSTCFNGKVAKTYTKTIKDKRYEVKVYPQVNSFTIFDQGKSITSGTENELLQRLTKYKFI